MRFFSALALLASLFAPLDAALAAAKAPRSPSSWSLSVGSGLFVRPRFEGSSSYGVLPLPALSLSYKDFLTVSPRGVSVKTEEGGRGSLFGYSLSARLGYDLGRDEDNDKAALQGLGDVKFTPLLSAEIGLTVFPLQGSLEITQGLGGGHRGTVMDFGLTAPFPLARRVFMMVSLKASWASRDYMREFYGISAEAAARSALYDQPFRARASIYQWGAGLGAILRITERWGARLFLDYRRMTGDAARSPIVWRNGDKDQFRAGMITFYRFSW